MIEPDIEMAEPPSDTEMRTVADLANLLRVRRAVVYQKTAELKQALADMRIIEEKELPEAMRAIGMSEFKLVDGEPVSIVEKLIGSQLTDDEGLAYVESHDGGSLIKTAVMVELDRGDLEAAREIIQELRQHRYANRFKSLSLSRYVHQSTIAAWVRELIADGVDVPLEKLGVYRRTTALVGERYPKVVELKGLAAR